MAIEAKPQRFNVGGAELERPFKIRRLGHFGFNLVNMDAGVHFYTELLGFRISDTIDFRTRVKDPQELAGLGDPHMYFTRYGTDHHAFVFGNVRVREYMNNRVQADPGITINQITWQVGSLREVHDASRWLKEQSVRVNREGRDMPGSNWHSYFFDPEGHNNEIYYGMEQIGWDGYVKPKLMYSRRFYEMPDLPQVSEFEEVEDALREGLDLRSGGRHLEQQASYDVDGIMLPRPFKIIRIGPVRLFMRDIGAAERFYTDVMGFRRTEDVVYEGHRCVFLRANTEHHSLALYPMQLRDTLGLSEHTTCMALGLQLATYQQLRDAVDFLHKNGVQTRELPAELFPGVGHSVLAFDPDGHAVHLYACMEQIGWDGRPRPAHERQRIVPGVWPDTVPELSDTYCGEVFLGPWG